jgi:hypothetical protein
MKDTVYAYGNPEPEVPVKDPEPTTIPNPNEPTPAPKEDDPWTVPAPGVEPTPKA